MYFFRKRIPIFKRKHIRHINNAHFHSLLIETDNLLRIFQQITYFLHIKITNLRKLQQLLPKLTLYILYLRIEQIGNRNI